ncbi:hypothetical protein BVJ53_12825 [Lacticaseibacillus chiayiensis]|uniref:CPBP family intramembrane metalloprotease n=1 Tax=Lacticaseibacillus chiayiensis TaxID=2100821 RepID=A0A4V1P018_9LACO|nr:CPBP family intramembrane glutamic endopeptidase [Lacticaseibacillus chiayiensis]QVI34715.1 CPBP family intramembrane metalloprotease [Lacticaseibacillus chiayiensis]RXT18970.1 hypothetical protein BVJ53_12825 [Lacticaseibacillus chiayiensis]UYN56465.1 CPBP family intramembrane metalloprotease [Lacticaseibacillus chiayiensis]
MEKIISIGGSLVKRSLLLTGIILLDVLTEFHDFFTISRLQRDQYEVLVIELILKGSFIWFLHWLYFRQLKRFNPNDYGLKPLSEKNMLILLIGVASLFGLLCIESLTPFNADNATNQVLVNKFIRTAPVLASIDAVLAAPIIEEFIFRGIFFNYFFNKNTIMSKISVVLVSGFVFGLLHEPHFTVNLLVYCTMGWLFGSVYALTGDLRYSTTLHILNNVLAFVSMF